MNQVNNCESGFILMADDDSDFMEAFAAMLKSHGFRVDCVDDGQQLAGVLEKKKYDLLLLDLEWQGCDYSGIDLLKLALRTDKEIQVIMLTAFASIPTAVEAIKLGAFDYIEKGKSIEKAIVSINNAIKISKLNKEYQTHIKNLQDQFAIIGASAPIVELKEKIRAVAPFNCNVLITGPTGTGKELVARQIHILSKRSGGKFVKVDLGLLPDTLAASALFGHKKGAFTGAIADQKGYFDEADGGTIFLDEVARASQDLQSKLLNVIQNREYFPLGSTQLCHCDVRIIAATNRDLKSMVERGLFAEDLYYRLNSFEISIPPLAERKEDIPLLARHFVNLKSRQHRGVPMEIESDAINELIPREWPGNVRQLESAIEKAVILSPGPTITAADIRNALNGQRDKGESQSSQDLPHSLENATKEFRKNHIVKVLNLCQGNVTKTAELLEINRSHLYRLLDEYGISQLAKELR